MPNILIAANSVQLLTRKCQNYKSLSDSGKLCEFSSVYSIKSLEINTFSPPLLVIFSPIAQKEV